MRSVRYGCMRTRSHSPAPSGPRLSQIAFDTPSRPKSCTRPARRSVRTSPSDSPSCVAGLSGQLGDRARVAEGVRRLQVDEVRDRQQRRVELLARRARRRAPARRRSPRPRSRPSRARRRSLPASAHRSVASVGIELLAAALAGERRRRLDPADAVRDLDELRELRDPRRERDAFALDAVRASRARPTARRPLPSASSTSSGSPSCSPSARASAACWAIMPSTSRWPESANSSPTRKRCSGGLPAPDEPQSRPRRPAGL